MKPEHKYITKERDNVIYDIIYRAITKYIKPSSILCNMEEIALTCLKIAYLDVDNSKERIGSIFKEIIDKFVDEGYIYNIENNEALYNNPNKLVNLDQQSVKIELYNINPITITDVLGL